MTLKQQALRNDLIGRLMPITTLRLILNEHKRYPWQPLYIFQWRHSPPNVVTIYDMDMPRRKLVTEDYRIGYVEQDWWNNSVVTNCSQDFLVPMTQVSRKTGDVLRPGYKDVLMRLLAAGAIVPSRCLDDWLLKAWTGEDSRKLCAPELRINYKRN